MTTQHQLILDMVSRGREETVAGFNAVHASMSKIQTMLRTLTAQSNRYNAAQAKAINVTNQYAQVQSKANAGINQVSRAQQHLLRAMTKGNKVIGTNIGQYKKLIVQQNASTKATNNNARASEKASRALGGFWKTAGRAKAELVTFTAVLVTLSAAAIDINKRNREMAQSQLSVRYALKATGKGYEQYEKSVLKWSKSISRNIDADVTDIEGSFARFYAATRRSGVAGIGLAKMATEVKFNVDAMKQGVDGASLAAAILANDYEEVSRSADLLGIQLGEGVGELNVWASRMEQMAVVHKHAADAAASLVSPVDKLFRTLKLGYDIIVDFNKAMGGWPAFVIVLTGVLAGAAAGLAGLWVSALGAVVVIDKLVASMGAASVTGTGLTGTFARLTGTIWTKITSLRVASISHANLNRSMILSIVSGKLLWVGMWKLTQAIGANILATVKNTAARIASTAAAFAQIVALNGVTGSMFLAVGAAIALAGGLWGVVAATVASTVAFLASPFGIVVIALAAITAAVILLWKHWDKIWSYIANDPVFQKLQEFFSGLGGHLKSLLAPLSAVWDTLSSFFGMLTGWFKHWEKVLIGLAALLLIPLAPIVILFGVFYALIRWSDKIKAAFEAAISGVVSAFNWVVSGVQNVINAVQEWYSRWKAVILAIAVLLALPVAPIVGLIAAVVLLVKHWDRAWSRIRSIVTAAFGWIGSTFGKWFGDISEKLDWVLGRFKDTFQLIGNFIDSTIGSAFRGILKFFGLVKDDAAKLREDLSDPQKDEKTRSGWEKFFDALSGGERAAESRGKAIESASKRVKEAQSKGFWGKLVEGAKAGLELQAGGTGSFAGSFQGGTDNYPGGTGLVGEKGPELVNLPKGSQIFSNDKTKAMLSGSLAGVSEAASAITQELEMVDKAMSKLTRNWRRDAALQEQSVDSLGSGVHYGFLVMRNNIQKSVGAAWGYMVDFFDDIEGRGQKAGFGSWIGRLWEGIKGRVSEAGSWFKSKVWDPIKNAAIAAWNGIGKVVDTVVTWVADTWEELTKWFSDTAWPGIKNAAIAAWNGVGAAASGTTEWVSSAWTTTTNWFSGTVWPTIQNEATSAWNGVGSAVSVATNWVSSAWTNITNWFSGTVWPAIKNGAVVAWNAIGSAVDTVGGWVSNAWTTTTNWFTGTVWPSIKNAAIAAWNGIGAAVEAVGGWISSAWTTSTNWFTGTVWPAIKNAAIAAWNGIGSAVGATVSWVSEAWTITTNWFTDTVWPGILKGATAAWNGIGSAVSTVVDWVSDAWTTTTNWFTGTAWPAIQSGATTAWNAVGSGVSTVASWVSDAWTTSVNWFTGTVWPAIQTGAQTAWQYVGDASKSLLDWISNNWQQVPGWFDNNVWSPMQSGAQTAFSAIAAGLDHLGSLISNLDFSKLGGGLLSVGATASGLGTTTKGSASGGPKGTGGSVYLGNLAGRTLDPSVFKKYQSQFKPTPFINLSRLSTASSPYHQQYQQWSKNAAFNARGGMFSQFTAPGIVSGGGGAIQGAGVPAFKGLSTTAVETGKAIKSAGVGAFKAVEQFKSYAQRVREAGQNRLDGPKLKAFKDYVGKASDESGVVSPELKAFTEYMEAASDKQEIAGAKIEAFSNAVEMASGKQEIAGAKVESFSASMDKASTSMQGFTASIDQLSNLGTYVSSSIGGSFAGAFQGGTSNYPGGTGLVGEKGPEFVNLPKGSEITPAAQTEQIMGGGSRGGGGLAGLAQFLFYLLETAQTVMTSIQAKAQETWTVIAATGLAMVADILQPAWLAYGKLFIEIMDDSKTFALESFMEMQEFIVAVMDVLAKRTHRFFEEFYAKGQQTFANLLSTALDFAANVAGRFGDLRDTLIQQVKTFRDYANESFDDVWERAEAGARKLHDEMESLLQSMIRMLEQMRSILNRARAMHSAMSSLASGGGVRGYARGTNNYPGGTGLVGEEGPELVRLPRGSQITPNRETMQLLQNMSGGRGGSQTITILLDGKVLAKAVLPHWAENVRMQGV